MYKLNINDKDFNVEIKDISPSEIEAEVNGQNYKVTIKDIQKLGGNAGLNTATPGLTPRVTATAKVAPSSGASITGGTIKSPIPGQIKLVVVKAGDKITAGQKVLILEAMKLENEINANEDGTVKKVHVSEGETVAQNQVLVELE